MQHDKFPQLRCLQQRDLPESAIFTPASLENAARVRDGDSGVPNDKAEYRNGKMLSFQTSPGSACGILTAVYLSGGSEETARRLPPFDYGPCS